MAKLSKGSTFTDGVSANAAALNNLVDSAAVLPGIITEFGAATPDVADSLLIYDNSAAGLAKCTLQNIIDAFPGDAIAATKALRSLGTASTQAAAGNDGRFPASVTGIRKGAGAASADSVATPQDLDFAPVNLSGLTNINWNAGNLFYEGGLPVNRTYTFSNVQTGRVIVFQVNQNGHTITFPAGWIVLGTANTASWNVYCLTTSPVASLITVAN